MNRGFGYYFKKSNDIFKFVFRKQKFSAKVMFLFYNVAALIGRLIFFIRPIFLISDQNLANMFINGHSFSIYKAFYGVKEKYGKIFLTELIQACIYMGVVLALLIPLIAPSIALAINFSYTFVLSIVLYVIFGLLIVAACLIISFNYKFVPFIAAKTKSLDCSDYLHNSHNAFKKNKKTIIAEEFVYTLIIAASSLLGLSPIALSIVRYFYFELNVVIFIVQICILIPVLTLLILPFRFKQQMCLHLMGEELCSINQSIVVKRRASSSIEYEPIFDVPSGIEGVDLNK